MELWDICDSKGIPTGRVMEKGKDLGDGEYHVAVEAWIMNTKGEFLIQKRSSRCVHYPNVWSLTAGRIQAGEDAKEGCIREVQEEIGLALEREELIHLAHINREDGSHMIWEVFLVRRDIPVSKLILDPEEDRIYFCGTGAKAGGYYLCPRQRISPDRGEGGQSLQRRIF